MSKNLPAKANINIPATVTQDSQFMREGFTAAWNNLVKVAERKAPLTDLTRVHMAMAAMYVKARSTEIHDKGLEILIRKVNGG